LQDPSSFKDPSSNLSSADKLSCWANEIGLDSHRPAAISTSAEYTGEFYKDVSVVSYVDTYANLKARNFSGPWGAFLYNKLPDGKDMQMGVHPENILQDGTVYAQVNGALLDRSLAQNQMFQDLCTATGWGETKSMFSDYCRMHLRGVREMTPGRVSPASWNMWMNLRWTPTNFERFTAATATDAQYQVLQVISTFRSAKQVAEGLRGVQGIFKAGGKWATKAEMVQHLQSLAEKERTDPANKQLSAQMLQAKVSQLLAMSNIVEKGNCDLSVDMTQGCVVTTLKIPTSSLLEQKNLLSQDL